LPAAKLLSMVAAALNVPPGAASEVSPIETQCRALLRRQVFDCACTANFLESLFLSDDGEILMTLWALAANESNQNQEFLNLYLRFGRKRVDAAVMNFHRHRDKLRTFCLQNGPNVAD
jgi:hypothetical protein